MSKKAGRGKDQPDLGFDISPIDEPPGPLPLATKGLMTSPSRSSSFTKFTNKNFIVYLVQLVILTIVIGVALLNLSLGWHKENKDMWVAMLSSCIGYMLPSPTYKRKM